MNGEIFVDLFCGGGGATEGVEQAGVRVSIAVNHDPAAVAMHKANHPETEHRCGDVFHVDPTVVCAGRTVAGLWASPDCTHHSKAKGGKPRESGRRALADVVIRWAESVKPRVIFLENVEEFADWGPLLADGTPDKAQKGLEFRRWWAELEAAGYEVEMRMLRACDFGAPTTRKRLFIIARCDGRPIVWPTPTHGPGRLPYRPAADCIDWTIPCPSIFDRPKPLVPATLKRIAHGLRKYVLDAAEPFVVDVAGRLAAPSMVQTSYGERKGQSPRALDLQKPLGTVVAGGKKHGLFAAFLAKNYGGHSTPGSSLRLPFGTVTTKDHHSLIDVALGPHQPERVRAFLVQYNGASLSQSLQLPLGTVTTRDRFGLVEVGGEAFEIVDIGFRMLTPRELFRAQGFADSYVIDPVVQLGSKKPRPLPPSLQVRMCGNSVCPPIARALVEVNMGRGSRVQVAA